MSVCVKKLPHSCGTSDGLQVFAHEDGKVDGYCYACNTFIAHPYGKPVTTADIEVPKPKTPEEIEREIAEVSTYPVVNVAERKLRAKYLDEFGVKVGLNEYDGQTPYLLAFPMYKEGKLSGYYQKRLGIGHITAVGDVRDADLFGWEQAKDSGAYRLIITEGLEDAVAVKQIQDIYGKEEKYKSAVVSLPNGTNSVGKALTRQADDIKRIFKEIVFCFDDDKAGHLAVEQASLVLPGAKQVILPRKDANACLMEGVGKAAYKALAFEAKAPSNISIIDGLELFEENRIPTPHGEYTWPFKALNDELRGFRLGETIYLGSGVKMGKSDLVDYLTAHFIKNHDVTVLPIKLEDPINKAFKGVTGKLVGSIFDDPNIDFDFAKYDEAKKWLEKGRLKLLDKYQVASWDNIKTNIVYSATQDNVKIVFVDPITSLTIGMESGEANTELGRIAQEAALLAMDLNITIIFTCHLKAPDNILARETREKNYKNGVFFSMGNCPHELGGSVISTQFTGSRSMMRSCHLMLGWEGNKDPALPENITRMRRISILEDRNFGSNKRIDVYRNPETGLYKQA